MSDQPGNREPDFFDGSPTYGSGLDEFYSETLHGSQQASQGSFGPVSAGPHAATGQRHDQIRQARTQFDHVDTAEADEDEASTTKSVIEWAIVLLGAVLLAFVIRTFLLQAFWIPSPSMSETLVEGDRILVNKLNYRFTDVSRLDVIVFKNPDQNSVNKELVKRVVGLPGEVIEIRAGDVFIDGLPLGDEPYISASAVNTGSFGPFAVPDGAYFVLGDNRSNSSDSRSSLGAVDRDLIVGKAFMKFWPFDRIGRIQ